jgi:uncharacterized protein (DUF885 family)
MTSDEQSNTFTILRKHREFAVSDFDVKDFHAVAIENGSMPLVVLEPLDDEWIARGGGPNKP